MFMSAVPVFRTKRGLPPTLRIARVNVFPSSSVRGEAKADPVLAQILQRDRQRIFVRRRRPEVDRVARAEATRLRERRGRRGQQAEPDHDPEPTEPSHGVSRNGGARARRRTGSSILLIDSIETRIDPGGDYLTCAPSGGAPERPSLGFARRFIRRTHTLRADPLGGWHARPMVHPPRCVDCSLELLDERAPRPTQGSAWRRRSQCRGAS